MDYEAKYQQLDASMANDPTALNAFLNDSKSVLAGAGIPTVESLSNGAPGAADAAAGGYSVTVSKHWWGFDFTMNEALTQGIINGVAVGPVLTDLVKSALVAAGILSATAPLLGVIAAGFAAGFALKKLEIQVADRNGKGVHWPVTWPQLAAVVAAAPLGPAAILAAIALWIHPFPN